MLNPSLRKPEANTERLLLKVVSASLAASHSPPPPIPNTSNAETNRFHRIFGSGHGSCHWEWE